MMDPTKPEAVETPSTEKFQKFERATAKPPEPQQRRGAAHARKTGHTVAVELGVHYEVKPKE